MQPIDLARSFKPASRICVGLAISALLAAPVAAAAGPISIELNRLEPRDNACRVSLVVSNPGDKVYDSLKLDLVFFDKDGVIARRLAVEAGPIRADKTTVKLFDADNTPCDGVGRVLLNDVTACGDEQDCLALVSTSSRVKGVEFNK